MKIAIFGGSFDPVHLEHVRLVSAAQNALGLDKVYVVPAYISPFKLGGAAVSGEDRLFMCKTAFRMLEFAEVSDTEISAGKVSYSYLTCRRFRETFPNDELYFLLGADALRTFPDWKHPEEILRCATLCVCGRGTESAETVAAQIEKKYGCSVISLPHAGKEVSSTNIRVQLFFGKQPIQIPQEVFEYVRERGLYTHPAVLPALALEKEERREHSFRVGLLAMEGAHRFGISPAKALLAAALHDCGKYVPLSSPMLKGFSMPEGVPAPVQHQFTGAYLAEYRFGVTDGEVLDAIRFHTSGRENMSPLGKLIFLADMLESERKFEGVELLRGAFMEDLDECFLLAMEHQIAYLRQSGKNIYPLTERAYLSEKSVR